MDTRHTDFDLEIVGSRGAYVVRVHSSPAGPVSADFVEPFSPSELARFINAVGPPRVTSRRLVPVEERVRGVADCGSALADALFAGAVGRAFRDSLATCTTTGEDLRIRLHLEGVPDLDALPWEYLYDTGLARFLALSRKTPVVRVLEAADPAPALTVATPLRVLLMISSPEGLPPLDVELEEQRLRLTAGDLVSAGLLEIEVLTDATLPSLQRALLEDFHVFHFMGHGGFDDETQEGVLAFEGDTGAHHVSGARLGTLLHDARFLQLAVINACEGARTSSGDAFSGVAQALVRQGLPAVVAMQTEISDRAALQFSHQFYWFLTHGLGIEATMCEVRKAMAVSDQASEWGTPVLLRSQSGQPFIIVQPPGLHGPTHAPGATGPGPLPADLGSLGSPPTTTPVTMPTDRPREPPRPPTEPARPATLRSWLVRALLFIGTPRPAGSGLRAFRRWLIGVGLVIVLFFGALVWWGVWGSRYSDSCITSITSSGTVSSPLLLPCATEVPRIDGAFAEWASGASHPLPAGAGDGTATAAHGSWKARWDNAGLYVYATVQDPTPVLDAVADPAAYTFLDGVTVFFGDDARRLQSQDVARQSDVAVSLTATSRGATAARITGAGAAEFVDAPTVLVQVIRGPDSFVLESRIPWAVLARTRVPRANSVMAFCLVSTDGVGDAATAAHTSGCQGWSGWQDGLRPGSWQTTILSLEE
ncbi:MAG: CHAT domain-containing protein [Humibacillus sp.]